MPRRDDAADIMYDPLASPVGEDTSMPVGLVGEHPALNHYHVQTPAGGCIIITTRGGASAPAVATLEAMADATGQPVFVVASADLEFAERCDYEGENADGFRERCHLPAGHCLHRGRTP